MLPFSLLIAEHLEHASCAQLPHPASTPSSTPSTLAPTAPASPSPSPDPGPLWAPQPCRERCGGGIQCRRSHGGKRNGGDPGSGDAAVPAPGGEQWCGGGGLRNWTRSSWGQKQTQPSCHECLCWGEEGCNQSMLSTDGPCQPCEATWGRVAESGFKPRQPSAKAAS